MNAEITTTRRSKRTDETIAALRREIAAGRFAQARTLPGERQLADLMRVSRTTLRRALADLVTEGLLSQRQGLGTVINSTLLEDKPLVCNIRDQYQTSGLYSEIDEMRDLACLAGPPSVDEAMALAMSPGAAVLRLSRLLLLDGRPLAVEHAAVPRGLLPDPAKIGGSLVDALAAHGIWPTRRLARLRCTTPTRVEAEHLDLPPGSLVLWRQEAAYLEGGRCCMVIRTIYRPDRVDLMCVAEALGGPA